MRTEHLPILIGFEGKRLNLAGDIIGTKGALRTPSIIGPIGAN